MTTTSTTPTLTGTYAIDPIHSGVGFIARHAMVTKVRGSFNEFDGSGYFDAENPANSKLELHIEAASIDTRNADRDGHLRSNDFFDMENHPQIHFVSTRVEQVDEENYRVSGDLTIKGVAKPVTVDFEFTGAAIDPFGNSRIGFGGKTTVNRKDWGVQLEHGARGRGRPRQREGNPRIRGVRHPVRFPSLATRRLRSRPLSAV